MARAENYLIDQFIADCCDYKNFTDNSYLAEKEYKISATDLHKHFALTMFEKESNAWSIVRFGTEMRKLAERKINPVFNAQRGKRFYYGLKIKEEEDSDEDSDEDESSDEDEEDSNSGKDEEDSKEQISIPTHTLRELGLSLGIFPTFVFGQTVKFWRDKIYAYLSECDVLPEHAGHIELFSFEKDKEVSTISALSAELLGINLFKGSYFVLNSYHDKQRGNRLREELARLFTEGKLKCMPLCELPKLVVKARNSLQEKDLRCVHVYSSGKNAERFCGKASTKERNYLCTEHFRQKTNNCTPKTLWLSIYPSLSTMGTCAECTEPLKYVNMQRGHINPACKGGKSTLDNLRPLCQGCNNKYGSEEM